MHDCNDTCTDTGCLAICYYCCVRICRLNLAKALQQYQLLLTSTIAAAAAAAAAVIAAVIAVLLSLSLGMAIDQKVKVVLYFNAIAIYINKAN
jgi:hypothetical protein